MHGYWPHHEAYASTNPWHTPVHTINGIHLNTQTLSRDFEDNPRVVTQIIGHFRDGGFFWQRSSFVGAKSGYSWVWHWSRLRSVSLFTPYLSPIHTKLVPQPRQLVLAVHHASVESYLLMCANTDIPLIMFINCGRVPYERFFCNDINKSSSWTYQSNRMINKCHICSKWPPPSGITLHLLHFKCSPRQFNEPQNIFF